MISINTKKFKTRCDWTKIYSVISDLNDVDELGLYKQIRWEQEPLNALDECEMLSMCRISIEIEAGSGWVYFLGEKSPNKKIS